MARHSFIELPSGYVETSKLDLEGDKRAALRVNILALVLLLPFAAIYIALLCCGVVEHVGLGVLELAIFFVGLLLILPLHELIHALFFKLLSPDGRVKLGFNLMFAYAGNPGVYYKRNAFLVIGLAPTVLLTLGLSIALLFVKGGLFFGLFMLLAVHFSGCAGDIVAAALLLRLPTDALASDTGLVMTFYKKTA